MLLDCLEIVLNGVINAQIENLKTGAFQHHTDEVFANIVYITLNSANHHATHRFSARLGEQGPQYRHTAFHRVGRHQNFRYKENPIAKINAHDTHALNQGIGQHFIGTPTSLKQDVGALLNLFFEAIIEIVMHLFDQFFVRQSAQVQIVRLFVTHQDGSFLEYD